MNVTERKIAAIKRLFPDAIKASDGRPWAVDALHATEVGETRSGAFYYENADSPPDRFYFDTFEEAALGLFEDVGEDADLIGETEWVHPDGTVEVGP